KVQISPPLRSAGTPMSRNKFPVSYTQQPLLRIFVPSDGWSPTNILLERLLSFGAVAIPTNIQELDTESELIDLSAATKLAEITTELSKSQLELTQPELREASGPVRGIKLLTEVLLNCGRKTLTFLLGEILCLHELLPFVPKREEHFLNYFPSQEIQRVDEEGDYHTVVQEIGEASYFVLESFINSHANFLRNIQALYTFLNLVYNLGQVQSLNPGPLETLRPELISLSNKLNQLPQVKRFSRKISIRELELLIKKTKKTLKKLILLAVSASEEQVQKVNRQSLQVNQSRSENQSVPNQRRRSRGNRTLACVEPVQVDRQSLQNNHRDLECYAVPSQSRRLQRSRRSTGSSQILENRVTAPLQTRELSPSSQSIIETEIRNNIERFQARLRLVLSVVPE
ncbi:hypothetical protein DAPPUDRAFT_119513, partial [Daphnia pulex]